MAVRTLVLLLMLLCSAAGAQDLLSGVVPGKADPVNAMLPTVVPLQTTWFRGLTTVGVGLMVMVYVLACPMQFWPAFV